MKNEISSIIDSIPIADTHEHLVDEKDRLDNLVNRDISLLFSQYVDSDLLVSGMPLKDLQLILDDTQPADRKWALIKPWWSKIRNTGYGLMILESIKILYGEDDLNDSNWLRIQNQISSAIKPGYYKTILQDLCNIDHCQINALDKTLFRETVDNNLFFMDLCISKLCSDFDLAAIENLLQRNLKSLDDCIEAIDIAFKMYGNRSVAVKNQSAYRRGLDYKRWSKDEVKTSFNLCKKKNWKVTRSDLKPVEDFLFHHSVDKAEEYGLAYKLHTGYHSGHGTMPLHNLRHNAGDLSNLCREHPKTNFVFMHIIYPYQDEAIALAKHYPNAYIDMCWAWMVNPIAAVRFLKEFLLAVPSNKIFLFGGDVSLVELVSGHLQIAKKGIAQALTELVSDGWLSSKEMDGLLRRLLLQNAYDLFPISRLKTAAE